MSQKVEISIIVLLLIMVAFAVFGAIRENKQIKEFAAKCERHGGKAIEYEYYRQPTKRVCVKSDVVIEL